VFLEAHLVSLCWDKVSIYGMGMMDV